MANLYDLLEAGLQLKGSSVEKAFPVTTNDGADLANATIAVYVGVSGDLKVDTVNGDTITMKDLASGIWHPLRVKRIYATGTTATDILGAY